MSKNVWQRFTTRLLFYWPGIAQAVVQTPLSLIPPNLQNILNQKWLKLGTWHFERRFIHLTPTVICHVSHVTCHISRVTCHLIVFFLLLFSLDKGVKLVGGGCVINRPNPLYFVIYSVCECTVKISNLWVDKACCWQRCATQTHYGSSSTLGRTMTNLAKLGYISFCLVQLLSKSISMKVFATHYNFTEFVSDELEFEGLTFKSDRQLPDKKFAEMTICFRINIDFFNVMGQYSSILELSGNRVSIILKFIRTNLK